MKILRAMTLLLPLTWTLTVQADDTKPTATPTTAEVVVLKEVPEIGDTLTKKHFEVIEIEGDGKAGDFNALEHQMGYEVQTVTMPTTKVWQPKDQDAQPQAEDAMAITLHTTRIHNGDKRLEQDQVVGVLVLTDKDDTVLATQEIKVGEAITKDEVMTWVPSAKDDFKPGQKIEVKLSVFRTDTTHPGFNLKTNTTVFSDDHKTYTSFETHAYTADEFVFSDLDQTTDSLEHEAVTVTKKSFDATDIVETTEKMSVSFPKLQTTKTGYGIPVDLTVAFAGDLPDLKLTRHKDLLADYNADYDQTQEVMEKTILTSGEAHFQMGKTYVERDLLGTLWGAQQVNRPANTVDGGNKLYVPVWFDFEKQKSDVTVESTQSIGVNQWTIKLVQTIKVNAFMYVSIGSPTLLQDELLIQPIFTHSFYEQYKDKNWFVDPEADTAWILSDDF